jgi:hypothetical protein
MTTFAKKTVPRGYAEKLQPQFVLLQQSMKWPHDLMLMVKASSDNNKTETIYVGLPEAMLLSHFDGFEPIKQAALPDGMTALVIRHDGLTKRFPDIAAKIHGKA